MSDWLKQAAGVNIREDCERLDQADPLRHLRDRFELPAGVIYLDGMSLGPAPRNAAARLDQIVRQEWATGLIRSWNSADWINAPTRIGAAIAPLIGAQAHEVVVADSTSVNLFKLLLAAVRMRASRSVILTDSGNFPTDVHVARAVARLMPGFEVRIVEPQQVTAAIDSQVAVVALTEVDYRSGQRYDMDQVTNCAHASGALMLWDLSHSAGAMPIGLNASHVDLAVGCGYKYFSGGPGAPAFLYVAEALQEEFDQPISGWLGHADPFEFSLQHTPAPGIARALTGTPPILALAALETAVALLQDVDLQLVHQKSVALGALFLRLVTRDAGAPLKVLSPSDPNRRGGHVALGHPQGYGIVQALIERQMIGDYREPDLLRFGFAAPYTRWVDAWDAAAALVEILRDEIWREPRFQQREHVT